MRLKKASFVLPAYNLVAFLAHAIKSCQNQKYSDIEIVVVDDCSTDTTKELMEFLAEKDKRIKYFRTDKNMGRSYCRNFGNDKATGEFIMVLDPDDLALEDRARLTAKKLQTADMIYGSSQVINTLGTIVGTIQADVFNLKKCLKDRVNYMVHSTLAYTKELSQKIRYIERGGGSVDELGMDDWAFQLEAALSGSRIDYIQDEICAYRRLPNSASNTRKPEDVSKAKDEFIEILTEKYGVTC